MSGFTHLFYEAGNGFPQDGEDVLYSCEGEPVVFTVVRSSPIHTIQYQANYVYLECVPAKFSWEAYTDAEQNNLYNTLHHVSPLDG